MTSMTPSLSLSMISETKATGAEIDAYATRVLEARSPPETCFIDDSLGPYVTSLLRCADITDKDQVTSIAEFDSLLELLEDQCNMDKETASDCVFLIADAVITQVLPLSERRARSSSLSNGCGNGFGMYTQHGGGLDSFRSMSNALPESASARKTMARIDSLGAMSAGGPSPLKLDNLIPIDLMGELDDPSPEYSPSSSPTQYQPVQRDRDSFSRTPKQSVRIQQADDFPPLGTTQDAFPPLGASVEKRKKMKKGSAKKLGHGKAQHHSDKDLAATLFRPARPRQNSIESEEATSRSRGSSNASTSMMMMASTIDEVDNSIYFQQQLNSCVEILLSMNPELSEEAASAAGLMANTDFNLAQHILDSAMAAPPICRHMLHDGCYRSDCTFSHDVDGHTCLFWLRGRCGKGRSCKFFHGFHEKLLDGIDTSQCFSQEPSTRYDQLYPPGLTTTPTTLSSRSTFSPLLSSSWQTPSILESASKGTDVASALTEVAPFSFANIASKGYENNRFSKALSSPAGTTSKPIPTVQIPQDLWNPHENRDSSVFFISDPLERYHKNAASVQRYDVIDLHFQSIKTFPVVLETILPLKLESSEEGNHQVWIVTGTGHHVGTKTHQKGGGALESAVIEWLVDKNYNFSRGKDRNGLGGALLVNR